MAETFKLYILASDKPFYEGECYSLIVPTKTGSLGVMARHSNYISAVITGEVSFTVPNGGGEEKRVCAVSGGLIKIEDNSVLVLVETAESPDEIDEVRAKLNADRAKEEMLQKRSRREYYSAKVRLARALNRLKVKNKP